jgi:hypothetical protein
MTVRAMPADQFWLIIEQAARFDDDPDAHTAALQAILSELPLVDVIAFDGAFRRYLNESYTCDLWGAAYVAMGGCSDDGFEYFRRWLVSKGRGVYEAALANPDSLAQMELSPGPDGVWEHEGFYNVVQDVLEEKGDEGWVGDHAEPVAEAAEPTGEAFEDEGEHLARPYPSLWRRFGRNPLPVRRRQGPA